MQPHCCTHRRQFSFPSGLLSPTGERTADLYPVIPGNFTEKIAQEKRKMCGNSLNAQHSTAHAAVFSSLRQFSHPLSEWTASHTDLSVENEFRRTAHQYMPVLFLPANCQIPAAQMNGRTSPSLSAKTGRDERRTRTGSASPSLSGTSLPHAHFQFAF